MKSLFNSWLEPSAVGDFAREGTTEIRGSLSIQDSPLGIAGATDPQPEDLVPVYQEYRVGPGDALRVRILDLLVRNLETVSEVVVDELGTIRLPAVGRMHAAGLTVRELEEELADYLEQQQILKDAQVIVDAVVRRGATYAVFGAISSPNVYPLQSPDLTLLEAVNFAGGLADVVTSIYVIRKEGGQARVPAGPAQSQSPPLLETPRVGQRSVALNRPITGAARIETPRAWDQSAAGHLKSSLTAHASVLPAMTPVAPTPPEDEEQARREVIEAIIPGQPEVQATQPSPAGSPPATTGPSTQRVNELPTEEVTTSQPRWIFLNGKWIELEPGPQEAARTGPEAATAPGRPLEFPVQPEPTIDWAEIAEEGQQRIIHVSAEALRNGDPTQDIIVRTGDTIRLTAGESGEYYMMGQINRPGAYSLTGRRLTLKTAVAAAGNLSALAWPARCTVYRRLGDREEMIQVDLDRIFAGVDPDFYVKKDDLIVFGTHPAAVFLAIMRNAFRLTYGFGFVYDRNFADVDTTRRNVRASLKAQTEAAEANRFQGLFQ